MFSTFTVLLSAMPLPQYIVHDGSCMKLALLEGQQSALKWLCFYDLLSVNSDRGAIVGKTALEPLNHDDPVWYPLLRCA